MRFVSSLCWLRKGAGKTPQRLGVGKDELKQIFNENATYYNEDEEEELESSEEEPEVEEKTKKGKKKSKKLENRKTDEKYHLDEYDDESDELKIDHLSSLACFPSNREDKYLAKNISDDDSDKEDFEIKPTDNILVCGHSDEDVCTLNSYVYNDEEASYFIHHDTILASFPLCIEWLDFDPTDYETAVNYVAVGTLNPWIEIWDLDIVDCLEPEFMLGSVTQKKKKLKSETKEKIVGHKKAVLDIKWNCLSRNVMASASADKTICLWDLAKMKQATKIRNHTDKVPTIEFHPVETSLLLAGSFDKTVALYDLRNPKENRKVWTMANEIERVTWNTHDTNQFLCGDTGGNLTIIDIRTEQPLGTIKAHEGSLCGISVSSKVPNMIVTASEDEVVKVWDVNTSTASSDAEDQNQFELVFEKTLKIGPINCAKPSPDSGFVFAFGGAESGDPCVWDVREIEQIRARFYPRMNIDEAEETAEMAKESRRKQRARKFKLSQRLGGKKKERKAERKAKRLQNKNKLKRAKQAGKRKSENVSSSS